MIKNLKQSHGFTIVELLVSISVAGFISTAMLAISLYLFGATIRSQVAAEMAINSHFTLRAIVEDLRLSDGIGVTNELTDANEPTDPPGGWVTDNANQTLIVKRPATDSDINIIYNEDTGDPFTNEFVYYVDDNLSLRKRLIRNDAAVGNSTKTTCPEGATSPTCPEDRDYTDYVSDFSFVFYDTANNVVDAANAEFVEVSITLERKVFGKTVSQTSTVTVKPRN